MTQAVFASKLAPMVRVILFKGNRYSTALLSKQAGPSISIEPHDLHPDAEIVKSWNGTVSSPLEDDMGLPVFAKYEGKYVALLGAGTVAACLKDNKPLKGKLLSNPTLKRALFTL